MKIKQFQENTRNSINFRRTLKEDLVKMSFNQSKVTFIDINREESKDLDNINDRYDMIKSIRVNFRN